METNVSIMFRNLIMPSLDSSTALFEFQYENKNIKINYPLNEPIKITFSQKFIFDKVNIIITVFETNNKKNKLLFRADLALNKAIFLEGKPSYEKVLTLIPTDYRDSKKAGKLYMEILLLDVYDEWKKNIKNASKKKSNRKFNSNSNNLNQNKTSEMNKTKIEFDDNISLLNISNIEDDNPSLNEKFAELVNIDYINQLKNVIEKDYQKLLPKDVNSLKSFNQNLYNKYREMGKKYNDIIKDLNTTNENVRNKAINYWNNYKDLKKKLYKKRIDLKKNKDKLEKEKNTTNNEKEEISTQFQKYKNEKNIFLKNLNAGEGRNSANELAVLSSGTNNSDIKMLSDAVKKISSLGYDIIDGMKIDEEERKILSVIIGTNLCDNIKNEEDEEEKIDEGVMEHEGGEYDGTNIKDDFEFGNKIVALIERDVNELYSRKLIHQIKIDQIDAITYSFSDDVKEKNVSFKIENNNLICIDSGESFTVWLLSNFSP